MDKPTYTEQQVMQFLGWLTVDIPELNSVEAPKLMDSWDRFLAKVYPNEDATSKT